MKRRLTLFDSVCLIVGITIGAGIYQMAPDIAKGAGGGWQLIVLWLVGGLLSLCGALCYAELAAAYPKAGGDYVYLGRAFGAWAGFLFGWIQMTIIRPGIIAIMAFTFATYLQVLWVPTGSEPGWATQLFAVGGVVVLTLVNLAGVAGGKWLQNILTGVKVLGVLVIVGAAFFGAESGGGSVASVDPLPISLALVFVLFTLGGWNEMAYVASEVKRPERNLLRALVLGITTVTILYLLMNGAFLRVLGYGGLASSTAVATDAVGAVWPGRAGSLVAGLVMVSALGAVNGLIFTGARISYALGADHKLFRLMGRWNTRTETPVTALLLQGGIAVLLILVLGNFVNTILYTTPIAYLFHLGTTIAVVVLRRKESEVPRPYRVTLYPLPVVLFAGVAVWLIYSSVVYKPLISAVALGVLLLGFPLYWWSRAWGR